VVHVLGATQENAMLSWKIREQEYLARIQTDYEAKLERLRPHLDRMAPGLAAKHGKSIGQMRAFMVWHGQGLVDHFEDDDDNLAQLVRGTDFEQWIFDPVSYHRERIAEHQADLAKGDDGGLSNWDDAVRHQWSQFEQEIAAA
jgi:hypothetical protein